MRSVPKPWARARRKWRRCRRCARRCSTASAGARAERRYKQLIGKGNSASLTALVADMQARDARDSARSVAPLKPAPDALLLDTTHMDVVTAVQAVLAHYALCLARSKP